MKTYLAELAGDEGSGESCRTFVFENENDTLGNTLKYVISRYPDVEFCGYTIPHPAENKMQFRIQTVSPNIRAIDILKRGLEDLEKMCDHIGEVFQSQVNSFKNSNN